MVDPIVAVGVVADVIIAEDPHTAEAGEVPVAVAGLAQEIGAFLMFSSHQMREPQ